jgi:hypothetical protein
MHHHGLRCNHCFRSSPPRPHPRRLAGFFGSGRPSSCPVERITQLTSDWLSFNLSQPFQPSTGAKLNPVAGIVNAAFRCNMAVQSTEFSETQFVLHGRFTDHVSRAPIFSTGSCTNAASVNHTSFLTEGWRYRMLILRFKDVAVATSGLC